MAGFGVSYMLDMYGCKEGTCDSLELHYRFLEELVHKIEMTPMSNPVVIHAPVDFVEKNGVVVPVERYPEKAGVSAWQPLIESGIQIHSIEPTHFSTIDIYTCGKMNHHVIKEFAEKFFGFVDCEEYLISRGNRYGKV